MQTGAAPSGKIEVGNKKRQLRILPNGRPRISIIRGWRDVIVLLVVKISYMVGLSISMDIIEASVASLSSEIFH